MCMCAFDVFAFSFYCSFYHLTSTFLFFKNCLLLGRMPIFCCVILSSISYLFLFSYNFDIFKLFFLSPCHTFSIYPKANTYDKMYDKYVSFYSRFALHMYRANNILKKKKIYILVKKVGFVCTSSE